MRIGNQFGLMCRRIFLGMNNNPSLDFKAIVHEYFPDADDELIHFILWEKTGYPEFWKGDIETCLREQLVELQTE